MKWLRPKNEDTRIVKKFAFFPKNTCDGYKIWLECYWELQEFVSIHRYFDDEFWVTRITATTKEKLLELKNETKVN